MDLKKLFELREYNELYQKDIAKILNVSQQLYSFWEKGTKIIPLKHLNTLCNYYKVSMDYILNLSNKNNFSNKMDILDKKYIGNNIRIVREKNKLSQRDLAKTLNTTSSTICAYEKGKTLVLTAFAYQICKEYKVSMDWLCGRMKKN